MELGCGCALREMSEDATEELENIPMQIYVRRIVRKKYSGLSETLHGMCRRMSARACGAKFTISVFAVGVSTRKALTWASVCLFSVRSILLDICGNTPPRLRFVHSLFVRPVALSDARQDLPVQERSPSLHDRRIYAA